MEIDTPVAISPNGSRPAPFRMRASWRWECCDTPGYDGFCIEARTNLTNAERDALDHANDEIVAYSKMWEATPEEERDDDDTPFKRQLAMIAPFIREWNVMGISAVTGEDTPVPPPAEGGAAVYDLIEFPMSAWLRTAVLNGFLSGHGLNYYAIALRRLREAKSAGSDGAPS